MLFIIFLIYDFSLFFFIIFYLALRLSESIRNVEVRAASRTLSVIKAAKLKNLLLPTEMEIEQKSFQTAQVSKGISTTWCHVVLCCAVWYSVVLCCVMSWGVVWCGVVLCCGVIGYCVVRCGVVSLGIV